jgi:hypothetical protein
MASRSNAALKAVPDKAAPEYDADGRQIMRIPLRGTEYVLREVDGGTYDEAWEFATGEPDDEGRRTTDFGLLNKKLVTESLTSPQMTMKEIQALPYAVRQVLFVKVNDLHPAFPKEGEPPTAESKNGASEAE